MYQVVIERQAIKQLARIPDADRNNITKAIKNLAQDPRPHGYIKLKGRDGYRIRIRNYRVIYNIHDNILTVFVLLIGNRKDIYD